MASVFTRQSRGLLYCEVEGLDELMKTFAEVNDKGYDIVTGAIRESGDHVLNKARGNASSFSRTGSFSGSLSIAKMKSGIKLKSNDEAAGVIEFANRGATYKPKSTDKRRNARKMDSFPVGVPQGSPPRAMVKAVNESTLHVQNKIAAALERAMSNG